MESKKKKLYIMRHGQTDWNVKYKMQGRTDIPLNEIGRQMAREVRGECEKLSLDVCYCSPLIRAKETAELALEGLGVPIIVEPRLTEMSFGIYEGMENAYQTPECPINILFQHPEKYQGVEGGETMDELFARTGDFLNEVISRDIKEGKNVLIIGHGAMNCSIISQIRGIEREKFWDVGIPNCEIIPLELQK